MTDLQKNSGEAELSPGENSGPEELVVSVPPASEYVNPDEQARQVKIFCYHCQQKLDVTGLMPFAHINCPSCGTDLIIPKWFDTYLLEEPCGRGGMASVYRALDIALDREVAVKILNPEGSGSMESFLNEARTAATINHSGVIPIYTCGIFENQAYIVMQFMPGGSLEQKLILRKKGAAFSSEDVMHWIHDVAEGLEYAARHGIIHHDVKPGNIMLDADGNAKIGDFGIAGRQQSPETAVKDSYGSPLYISPEKISTGKEDSSGDIYSLGATFYHLLTGIPPFQHENLEELLWIRVKQNPVAPHQLRPGISPLISSLIMRMMHRNPDSRPGYPEIIRNLNAVLHDTDTASLIMRKDLPLPKKPDGTRTPASASALRVKSPSVMLKRRRSSIARIPAAEAEELAAGEPEPVLETAPTPLNGKKDSRMNWVLLMMITLSALMVGFIIFSAVLLIRAEYFSPETVLSGQPGEHR